jgi:hypothetical protein
MKNSAQEKQRATLRKRFRARRNYFFERVICRGCRNGCRGSALSRSWAVDISDGFA